MTNPTNELTSEEAKVLLALGEIHHEERVKSCWDNLAYIEFNRTKGLSAFSFKYNPLKRKLNQHCIVYKFADNSSIKVYNRANRITCFNKLGECQAERIMFV